MAEKASGSGAELHSAAFNAEKRRHIAMLSVGIVNHVPTHRLVETAEESCEDIFARAHAVFGNPKYIIFGVV